jgi:hypothetical protein
VSLEPGLGRHVAIQRHDQSVGRVYAQLDEAASDGMTGSPIVCSAVTTGKEDLAAADAGNSIQREEKCVEHAVVTRMLAGAVGAR